MPKGEPTLSVTPVHYPIQPQQNYVLTLNNVLVPNLASAPKKTAADITPPNKRRYLDPYPGRSGRFSIRNDANSHLTLPMARAIALRIYEGETDTTLYPNMFCIKVEQTGEQIPPQVSSKGVERITNQVYPVIMLPDYALPWDPDNPVSFCPTITVRRRFISVTVHIYTPDEMMEAVKRSRGSLIPPDIIVNEEYDSPRSDAKFFEEPVYDNVTPLTPEENPYVEMRSQSVSVPPTLPPRPSLEDLAAPRPRVLTLQIGKHELPPPEAQETARSRSNDMKEPARGTLRAPRRTAYSESDRHRYEELDVVAALADLEIQKAAKRK